MNVAELLRSIGWVMTCPEWTCSAAMIETVPCGRTRFSRRAARPGAAGCSGCLRLRAPIAVFSSTQMTIEWSGWGRKSSRYLGGFGEEVRVGGSGQPAADPGVV